MGNWDELKRLAEAELSLRAAGETYEGEIEWLDALDEFNDAVDAETILALIAENERLQAERDQFSAEAQQLDDFSETLGLEIAEAGKREIAHRAERDQLRAESERLQNLACAVNSAMHAAGMPVGADPAELADVIHGLQVQVATLQSAPNSWQSGYDKGRADGTRARLSELEQERRINAELRAEVEALQDAIKDMLFAMQADPSCQMGVVERCRCWFCAIGRAKAAMDKDAGGHSVENQAETRENTGRDAGGKREECR